MSKKYSIDKIKDRYDIFLLNKNDTIEQEGIKIDVGVSSNGYSLNSRYVPYFSVNESNEDLISVIMNKFMYKFGDNAIDNCVAQYLTKNAGLTINEETGDYNSYNVMVEEQTGNITILNGKTLTNVGFNKDGSMFGYSQLTKYGYQDPSELPFINDIGQSGKTTDLISSFYANSGVGVSVFQTSIVKATDYPPEPEVVRDEYYGTCVLFADKQELNFNSKGNVIAEDSKEDYLMIPYIQSQDGEVTQNVVDAKTIDEFFRVVPQTMNGDLQINLGESMCQ